MSMTISAANYLGSTRQNSQIGFSEKHEPKDSGTEAGKTEQAGGSARYDQVNLGEDGIAVTQVSRQQGAEQSAGQRKSTAPSKDTVEISAEGQAACARLQGEQAEDTGVYQYEAEDLSEYTDTELKQMYRRGEITRQEYEDETGETVE